MIFLNFIRESLIPCRIQPAIFDFLFASLGFTSSTLLEENGGGGENKKPIFPRRIQSFESEYLKDNNGNFLTEKMILGQTALTTQVQLSVTSNNDFNTNKNNNSSKRN